MATQLTTYNKRNSCDLNVFKVESPQFPSIETLASRWREEARNKMALIGKASEEDYSRMDDSEFICRLFTDLSALDSRAELYLCQDMSGNAQAIMLIWISQSIDVTGLASNPWNLVPRINTASDRPVSGAGTALVERAIKRGIELGKECTITDLDAAASFYEKLGFERFVHDQMHLTQEKIRALYSHLFLTTLAA